VSLTFGNALVAGIAAPRRKALTCGFKSKRSWMLSYVRGGGWPSPLLAPGAVRRPEILRAWVNR